MSRQARLLLIIAGMAVIGVVTLGVMAQRYSGAIAERQSGGTQSDEQAGRAAQRQVDAFVRVRMMLRERTEKPDFVELEPDARIVAFVGARSRALASSRLGSADYRELRQLYRQWRRDPSGLPAVWRGAFVARAGELQACDLGDSEALDR